MTVKLLTKHRLEFLSLKGGCQGSFESIHVKMPHCWKSHVVAHMFLYRHGECFKNTMNIIVVPHCSCADPGIFVGWGVQAQLTKNSDNVFSPQFTLQRGTMVISKKTIFFLRFQGSNIFWWWGLGPNFPVTCFEEGNKTLNKASCLYCSIN